VTPAGAGGSREVSAALDRLRDITHRQIEAARALRGAELARWNRERVDALFELKVLLTERRPKRTPELSAALSRLRADEERLEAVARTVLAVVQRVDPSWPPTTYGRSGELR
jgi:hypothetical protein